jgi:Lrp/AsnC family leucine-responsive transcriptional regulator
MDDIDRQILTLLSTYGRMPHEEIGRQLHISRPTVHQRVARMEHDGVLRGYRGVVDWSRAQERIKALIFIKIRCADYRRVIGDILALRVPGVTTLDCQRLAGPWCMVLKVRVSDPHQITDLIDGLALIHAVQETSTTFILDTLLEDGVPYYLDAKPEGGNTSA